MFRPKFRRTPKLELLESRQLMSSGGPTDQQQYMLYLLNQTRTNPAEMATRVTSNLDANVSATVKFYNVNLNQVHDDIAAAQAQPPLAWNDQLAQAATDHSQDQANTGIQSHSGSNGSSLDQRLDQAGFTNRTSDGENVYAYSQSVDEAMEAFLIDWGVASEGHRNNILQPGTSADSAYREVGIGIVNTNKPDFGPMVITQDFGSQQGDKAQLLGVAFNDPTHSELMALGQGQGGVTVQATNVATGATSSVQTWDSGGYQMPLDPGTYEVTALENNQVIKSEQVQVGDVNVEVDFDLNDVWQGGSAPVINPAPAVTAAPAPTPTPAPTPAPASPPTPTAQVNFSSNSNSGTTGTAPQAQNQDIIPLDMTATSNKSSSNSSSNSSTGTSSSSSSSQSNTASSSDGWSIWFANN